MTKVQDEANNGNAGDLLTLLVDQLADAVTARVATDSRGKLIVLADGWGPVRPATLQRWARTGRLQAFKLERGKLASWERDLRAAVEATPVELAPLKKTTANTSVDDLLDDDDLEVDSPPSAVRLAGGGR